MIPVFFVTLQIEIVVPMKKSLLLLALVAVLAFPTPSSAASLDEILAKLQDIQTQIAALKARGGIPTVAGAVTSPTCSLRAIPASAEFGDKVKISWTSEGAKKAQWVKDTSGKDTIKVPSVKQKLKGSRMFKMTVIGNPTLTMKVTGYDKTTNTCSVTIPVSEPDMEEEEEEEGDTTPATPTVSLTASPQTVQPKGTTALTWASENAQRCVLQTSVGGEDIVSTSGNKNVNPLQTTTYTLWCANDPGTGKDGPSASASVTVFTAQY